MAGAPDYCKERTPMDHHERGAREMAKFKVLVTIDLEGEASADLAATMVRFAIQTSYDNGYFGTDDATVEDFSVETTDCV